MSETVEGEAKAQLIDRLKQHPIERTQIAQLYADLTGENPTTTGSEATIQCHKCGEPFIEDSHTLVKGYGYLFHKKCVKNPGSGENQ